jgi:CHAT domain-containing protein
VLEAPKELLPQQAMLQRQDLLARYPILKDLHDQVENLRQQVAAMPLAPENAEAAKKQGQLMSQLQSLGRRQEIMLREVAVRREPALMAFPPLRTADEIRKSLPPGHALLVFYATSANVHAFLLNRDKYADWQLPSKPQALLTRTATLLRKLGNVSTNYELTAKDLADTHWRQDAKELLDTLLKGTKEVDLTRKFDELTIVPDGPLWYLPFEALQVQVDGQQRPLISRFRIRYAPTAGLSTIYQEIGHRRGNTAVLAGKLSPKMDDSAVDATVKGIFKSLPGCVTLKLPLPAAAQVFVTAIDRLVVLDELNAAAASDPYGWSPLPAERAKNSGALSDWFPLPRRGPDEMILPGYHTACETSLKRADLARRTNRGASSEAVAPGNEIFLSLCGLMSTGTRTVLLSRWRSGGQASLDFVREFTQELPHTTPSDAFQRAVQVVSNSPLIVQSEPRVKQDPAAPATEIQAAHPFFWAGYMVVDGGSPEEKGKK